MDNIYYDKSGSRWSKDEEEQLLKLYCIDKLEIGEICKIHRRFLGGVSSRLQKLNVVSDTREIRGHWEFVTSEEFKKMKEDKMILTKRGKEKKEKINCKQEMNDELVMVKLSNFNELNREVKELKSEIQDMKKLIYLCLGKPPDASGVPNQVSDLQGLVHRGSERGKGAPEMSWLQRRAWENGNPWAPEAVRARENSN